ncbi:MAG: hypothetical protein OXF50_13205 [Caldilineaceae bacterium]|nr:hypothetical protein [Caldilineaceae bacterium]MDE0077144.1 hypothetical protein [Caldilineaceae bacterium]
MSTSAPLTSEKERIQELLQMNLDARRYFFHKADERWLDWLWRNGFLNVFEEEETSHDGFRTPEFGYLLRMAEKCPAQVVDIMLAIPISSDTRSQEVVYAFSRICGALPADQLARMIDKIRTEKWVLLLDGVYNLSGFAYEEMLSTLAGSKDFESFLLLAEAVLAVRPGEGTGHVATYRASPFYLDDLARTKLFEQLAAVGTEYVARALVLTTSRLAEIIAASGLFLLAEVDFFTLEPGQSEAWEWEADVRELAAAAKTLAVRLIGERCAESDDVRRIYKEHLASLPESRVMRRFRLYVLSLCPEAFKDELKGAFFQLFEVEDYREIASGAEYEKALQTGFSVLSDNGKQEYVQRVIRKFSQPHEYRIHKGSHILSMILPYLNENPVLKKRVDEAGFHLDPDYEPQPSIIEREGGFISPRGPIQKEEFRRLTVVEIAGNLRQAWTPEELHAQNSQADFFSPLNAQGMGDLLKGDIPERLAEYVESAGLFFERGVLDQHYTYTYLTGLQEAIKNDRAAASEVEWDGVIELFTTMTNSDASDRLERGPRELTGLYASSWLANWDAVYSAMADVLRELLTEQDGWTPVDFGRHRDRILAITGYLLSYPDPSQADEQVETAPSLTESSNETNYSVIDPFTMAINSVRGRAFQAFVQFVFQDGRKFNEDIEEQISDEVKTLYENVLRKENTRALKFMYGHYLPSFYFRDRAWIRKLLPRIFPQEPAQRHLYTSAWEGYLARNLYEEMFLDPVFQNLYQRALDLRENDFPRQQRHFKSPDEGLAQHLALAFMHYEEFGFDHQLFEAFWKNDSPKQHAHFVNFIGRSFISRDQAEESFEFSREVKGRLRELWDRLLQNDEEREVYMEFGFWINLDRGIFEPGWLARRVKETLEKADGFLKWDNELVKASPRLAQAAPEDTLEIARLYLHEGGVRGKNQRVMWLWESDNPWIEALEILQSHPSTKGGTEGLIHLLVGEGEGAFWPLKPILGESA